MKRILLLIALSAGMLAIAAGLAVEWNDKTSYARGLLQQMATPGPLSQSHAFLHNACASCHTPLKGAEAGQCIACHADDIALLQRQPTAFHATVQVCSGCHLEHKGLTRMPTTMDHALFEDVASRSRQFIEKKDAQGGNSGSADRSPTASGSAPHIGTSESALNCANCHATKDRHNGYFGTDCSQCHATTQWTIVQFIHPPVRSTECAQCHKEPPSHNMMHFSMMSAPIAGQRNAGVKQCFLCHQSTAWNDIKGVGWFKHH